MRVLENVEKAHELLMEACTDPETQVAHLENACRTCSCNLQCTKDERGRTALQLACHHQLSSDVVAYLANKWPEALDFVDVYGMTPLHSACQRSSLEVVKCLTRLAPQLLLKPNRQDRLPLHMALRRTTRGDDSLAIVQYLLQQDPSVLSSCDACGLSSLHLACIPPNNSIQVVQYIIDRDPTLLLKKSIAGFNPLHFVFSFASWFFENDSAEDFSLLAASLIRKNPKILEVSDNDGRTPFDLFPWTNSLFVERLMQCMVKSMYPFVCGQYHDRGRSILHVALQHGSHIDTNGLLEMLAEVSPEVLTVQDDTGATPLHLACRGSSEDIVRLLVRTSPEALLIADSLGHYPSSYALSRECMDVTYFLIRRDPSQLIYTDSGAYVRGRSVAAAAIVGENR